MTSNGEISNLLPGAAVWSVAPPEAEGFADMRGARADPPIPQPDPDWVFPDPSQADEDDIVGIGADLRPPTLVHAYRRGIFPWPHTGVPLPWFSPDPRAVLSAATMHVSRSLRRTLRKSRWHTTADEAFADVVAGCADREEGTWIIPEMSDAYVRLHELGWAHSVEVWEDSDLVGGIYGVQVGACFTGESMFHRRSDASKVALVDLVDRFTEAGGRLLDAQIPTPHLKRMGVREVSRDRFLDWLARAREHDVRLPLGERPVRRLADRS